MSSENKITSDNDADSSSKCIKCADEDFLRNKAPRATNNLPKIKLPF
jgi:hypothetical protein